LFIKSSMKVSLNNFFMGRSAYLMSHGITVSFSVKAKAS
jgi:hypothetical protein